MTDKERQTRLAAIAALAAKTQPILHQVRTTGAATRAEKQELKAAIAYLDGILASRRETSKEPVRGLSPKLQRETAHDYPLIVDALKAAMPFGVAPGFAFPSSEGGIEGFLAEVREELAVMQTKELRNSLRLGKATWLFTALASYARKVEKVTLASESKV